MVINAKLRLCKKKNSFLEACCSALRGLGDDYLPALVGLSDLWWGWIFFEETRENLHLNQCCNHQFNYYYVFDKGKHVCVVVVVFLYF